MRDLYMYGRRTPEQDYPGYVEIDCTRRVKIEKDSRPRERICGSAISGTKHISTGKIGVYS